MERLSSVSTTYSIPERIDRLPMSRELWRPLLLAGIAWLIESYDIGLIGSALPSLQRQYGLSPAQVGLVAVASALGIVVAVIPGGWLADHIGRKKVLVAGTAWYACFSLLGGLAPTPAWIVALRALAGLGMGLVFPIPYTLAAELSPRRYRGAVAGILDAFLSVGYFAAPLLAFLLIPRLPLEQGWRYLFFVGGLPLLYVLPVLKWLPESPRWLASKGRAREANRIVRGVEAAVERRTGGPLPEPERQGDETAASARTAPLASLFRGPYRRRTLMLWVAFPCLLFVFYAVQTYTPTVLLKRGYGLGDAFLVTALIVGVSIPGKVAEAFAVERFGRKPTIIWFGLVSAAGAVLFGLLHWPALIVLLGLVLSFFGIGVDPAIKIYGAEQYPTHLRETGVGFMEGSGRLFGGALAPFIMSLALSTTGVAGSYLFVGVVALAGVLAVALLGEETQGRSLEVAAGARIAALARRA